MALAEGRMINTPAYGRVYGGLGIRNGFFDANKKCVLRGEKHPVHRHGELPQALAGMRCFLS